MASVSLMAACGGGEQQVDQDDDLVVDSSAMLDTDPSGILVEDNGSGKEFSNAILSMQPIKSKVVGDSVELTFNYHVTNYKLGDQTPDASSRGCANSKDGQHIHFLLDDKAYVALYKPTHTTKVAKNSEHYVLSFLSRSYHESIKEKEAHKLVHFSVGEDGSVTMMDNPTSPMIFHSRPKGDYIGADTANLLLDYYLVNANLGADTKVKATISNTISGKSREIVFDSWKPMMVNGLGLGKSKVTLELVDANNQPISGAHTSTAREFTLNAAEPLADN